MKWFNVKWNNLKTAQIIKGVWGKGPDQREL